MSLTHYKDADRIIMQFAEDEKKAREEEGKREEEVKEKEKKSKELAEKEEKEKDEKEEKKFSERAGKYFSEMTKGMEDRMCALEERTGKILTMMEEKHKK